MPYEDELRAPCGCCVECEDDIVTCEHCDGDDMCVHCFAAYGHVEGRMCKGWVRVEDGLPRSGEYVLVAQEWDSMLDEPAKGHTVYLTIYSSPGSYRDDRGRFASDPGWWHEHMCKFLDGVVAWCRYPKFSF
jgi:hypothetical protein